METIFRQIEQRLKVFFLAIFLLQVMYASGQTEKSKISGILICGKEPLPGVTVRLLMVDDSTLVSGTISNLDGAFEMEVENGIYILSAAMMGYKSQEFNMEVTQSQQLDTLFIEEERLKIDEVTVVGAKNLIEYSAGKMTVDPSASIASSQGNVFDALKSIPGLIVNDDGSIMLNGQTGVKVQLNGRDSYLSGTALANLLKSTAAASVDKIDVVSNPTAEYDAEGKAGVVNIQMKKKLDRGVSFATNIDYQQFQDARGNIWAQTTYRKEKVGVGVDFYHYRGKEGQNGKLFRAYDWSDEKNAYSKNISQTVYLKNDDKKDNITLFSDIDISKKLTLDGYVNGNFFQRSVPGGSLTWFLLDGVRQDSLLDTKTTSDYRQTTYNGGLRLNFKSEKEVKVDVSADYLDYTHKEKSGRFSARSRQNSIVETEDMYGDLGGDINIFSAQTNFSKPIYQCMLLKVGLKSVWTDIDNRAIYKNLVSEELVMNYNNSSKYAYHENINAAYVQVEGKVEKWGALVGFRLEDTRVDGTNYGLRESEKDVSYSRRDCELFPTVGCSYTLNENQNLSLIYNRRITRPNYKDLSPFNYMADEYTQTTGNPNLKAELTHNLEFAYVLGKSYRVSIFGTYTSNIISQGLEKKENGGFLAYPQNLSSNRRAGLKMDAGRLIDLKWWQTSAGVILCLMESKWQELGVNDSKSSFIPMCNFSSQWLLPKNWSLQLTGRYNGKIPMGQLEIPVSWTMDGGLRKKWRDGKMSLSLYVNDIFSSIVDESKFQVFNMVGNTWVRHDKTTVGVSFYYSFSKGKLKENQNEKREMEERKRINF